MKNWIWQEAHKFVRKDKEEDGAKHLLFLLINHSAVTLIPARRSFRMDCLIEIFMTNEVSSARFDLPLNQWLTLWIQPHMQIGPCELVSDVFIKIINICCSLVIVYFYVSVGLCKYFVLISWDNSNEVSCFFTPNYKENC